MKGGECHRRAFILLHVFIEHGDKFARAVLLRHTIVVHVTHCRHCQRKRPGLTAEGMVACFFRSFGLFLKS
jgi:hypothetical protein